MHHAATKSQWVHYFDTVFWFEYRIPIAPQQLQYKYSLHRINTQMPTQRSIAYHHEYQSYQSNQHIAKRSGKRGELCYGYVTCASRRVSPLSISRTPMPWPITKERRMGLNIIHFRLHVFNEHFSFCHSLSVCYQVSRKVICSLVPEVKGGEITYIFSSLHKSESADIFICFSPYANQKLLGISWVSLSTFIILSYSFLALDICMICLLIHNQKNMNTIREYYSTASKFLAEGAFCNAWTPFRC